MNLKIISKQYQKNYVNRKNMVYFNLDGKDLELPIVFIKGNNYFLEDKRYTDVEEYVTCHYNCNFNDFKNYFLYKLYKYSKHKGLAPVPEYNLSSIKYKE